jgi:hypothetical protein
MGYDPSLSNYIYRKDVKKEEIQQKNMNKIDIDYINQLALEATEYYENSQFDRGVWYGFRKGYKKAIEDCEEKTYKTLHTLMMEIKF